LEVKKVTIEEIATKDHRYSFNGLEHEVFVDESNTVSVDFIVSGGGEATVNSVRIKRYGLTIAGALFDELYDCINLCDSVDSHDGIRMGPTQ